MHLRTQHNSTQIETSRITLNGRVSWLAQNGFAPFGKEVQLISKSTYDETEQLSRLTSKWEYTCHFVMISNYNLDFGGRGVDIAYP